MPALDRYLEEMIEQQQQQQQQELDTEDIRVDVHNSDDVAAAAANDDDCATVPYDRRHSDGQCFSHTGWVKNGATDSSP